MKRIVYKIILKYDALYFGMHFCKDICTVIRLKSLLLYSVKGVRSLALGRRPTKEGPFLTRRIVPGCLPLYRKESKSVKRSKKQFLKHRIVLFLT